MLKYLIGLIVLAVVIAGGVYLRDKSTSGATSSGTSATQTGQIATSTYATSTFAIDYPADYTVDTAYIYDQVNPKKPISGVKFTIPLSMATGSNLSSDTYLSVEWLPRAKNCTGDIYLAANVRAEMMTENGVNYSVATSSGAGAGNFYDERVYALSDSKPCTAVRYYIHSSNIGNYPPAGEPGAVREFDQAALLAAFDTIRQSLLLRP